MSYRRVGLVTGFLFLAASGAWAQNSGLDGAWLEDGLACADVYASNGKTISFKRPTNVFVAAFILRGRQLSTPLATCRIGRIEPKGDRQVFQLSCTTAIATESTRAILALTPGGGLDRYNAVDGGAAAKYQRCTADGLKTR